MVAEMGNTTKARILIVEDEAIVAADLEALVNNQGYEIYGVISTAEKALEAIAKEQPDLVLMDIVLKGAMDGIEAAVEIRSRWQIPVIFCTGYADEKRLQKAKLSLPFGYILKPFNDRNIKVTIEMALYAAKVDAQRQKMEEDLRTYQIELEMQNEELRRTHQELEKARDRYIDLYDFAPVGYFTISKKGMIEEANLTGAALLGVERSRLNKKPFSRFIAPDFQDMHYIHHNRVFETGTEQTCELKLMHKQGTSFTAQLKSIAVQDDQGDFNQIRTAVLDITAHKEMEEALQRAKKLEALGILAGGFAHDYNNLLTTMVGNLSFVKPALEPDSEAHLSLMEIEQATVEAADLTKKIITFAKGVAPILKAAPLAPLLNKIAEHAMGGPDARCKVSIADDLYPVEIDEDQIRLTLNNLMVNAAEAISAAHEGAQERLEPGLIKLRAENTRLTAGNPLSLKEGKYVRISIQDNGNGIPEANRKQIFDPYFSSKERGVQRGMGMGLPISYSIIRNHHGHISVESQMGFGTTFHIHLPASDNDEIGDVP